MSGPGVPGGAGWVFGGKNLFQFNRACSWSARPSRREQETVVWCGGGLEG